MSLRRHGCHEEANLGWDLADNNSNSTVNNYLVKLISVLVSNAAVGCSIQSITNKISRTELDSHANMPLMNKERASTILQQRIPLSSTSPPLIRPLQARRDTYQVYVPISGMSGAISEIEI